MQVQILNSFLRFTRARFSLPGASAIIHAKAFPPDRGPVRRTPAFPYRSIKGPRKQRCRKNESGRLGHIIGIRPFRRRLQLARQECEPMRADGGEEPRHRQTVGLPRASGGLWRLSSHLKGNGWIILYAAVARRFTLTPRSLVVCLAREAT